MKNSQKGYIVPIIIVLAALLIGGGIYLFVKSEQLANIPVAQNENQIATSTDTIGWQTYTNTKYGYQIKYPVGVTAWDTGANGNPGEMINFSATSSSFHFQVDAPDKIYQTEDNGQTVCDQFDSGIYSSVTINGLSFDYGGIGNQYDSMNDKNEGDGVTGYCTIDKGVEYRIIFYQTPADEINSVLDSFKLAD